MEREHQDRRGFLRLLVGGVAAAAAVRTFPFRVFSFPAAPVIGDYSHCIDLSELVSSGAFDQMIERCARELGARAARTVLHLAGDAEFSRSWFGGSRITIHESRVTSHQSRSFADG